MFSDEHFHPRPYNHLRDGFYRSGGCLCARPTLAGSGIVQPAVIGAPQIAGMIIGGIGTAVALWCVFTFAFIGKGTPAAFDAPRQLVIRGPYRFVRNPMYIGAGLALVGAALFYQSWPFFIYAGVFLVATHLFVLVCMRSRRYDELSAKNMKRIAAGYIDGWSESDRRVRAGQAISREKGDS